MLNFLKCLLLITFTSIILGCNVGKSNMYESRANNKFLSENALGGFNYPSDMRASGYVCAEDLQHHYLEKTGNNCKFKQSDKLSINIDFTLKEVQVTNNSQNTYPIAAVKAILVNNRVYILAQDKALWRCDLAANGKCFKDIERNYTDMMLIYSNAQISSYSSVMLLVDPSYEPSTDPSGGVKSKSQLVEILSADLDKEGKYPEVRYEDSSASKDKISVIASKIDSDMVMVEKVAAAGNGYQGEMINYSFGLISDPSEAGQFSIEMTYPRTNEKGNVTQIYFGNLNIPGVIKSDLSSKSKNHQTIVTPYNAPIGNMSKLKDYKDLVASIRRAAGGATDKDDNYEYCKGKNVYCNIFPIIGYDATRDMSYAQASLANAVFLSSMLLSAEIAGSISSEISTVAQKSEYILLKGLGSYAIPFGLQGSQFALVNMYANNAANFFSEYDKSVPLITLGLLKSYIINKIKVKEEICTLIPGEGYICHKTGKYTYKYNVCHGALFSELQKHEMALLRDPSMHDFTQSSNIYDLYTKLPICKPYPAEQIFTKSGLEVAKQIRIDSLSSFKRTSYAYLYQELFLNPENSIDTGINLDDIHYSPESKDTEAPRADMILQIPNCIANGCDRGNLRDKDGNLLKDKSGKNITLYNGNFIDYSYQRYVHDFRLPFNPLIIYTTITQNLMSILNPRERYQLVNFYQMSDLTCDKFDELVKQRTGGNTAYFVDAGWTQANALILDKNGERCSYKSDASFNYNNYTRAFDPRIIGNFVAMLPIGTTPEQIGLNYMIQFGFGLYEELKEYYAFDDSGYMIYDGHIIEKTPEEAEGDINCQEINYKRNDFLEEIKQISPSQTSYPEFKDGLWVLTNKGIHFITKNLKNPINLLASSSFQGISSRNKELITHEAIGLISQNHTFQRYDENKIFDYQRKNPVLAYENSEKIKLNGRLTQNGLFKGYYSNFMIQSDSKHGKLYLTSSDELIADLDDALAWGIDNGKEGKDLKKPKGTIDQWASGDSLLYTAEASQTEQNKVSFKLGKMSGDSVKEVRESGSLNSTDISYHGFTTADNDYIISGNDFRLYSADISDPTLNSSGQLKIPKINKFINNIDDIIGMPDGTIFVASHRRLFSCKIDLHPVPKPIPPVPKYDIKLNFINSSSKLTSVELVSEPSWKVIGNEADKYHTGSIYLDFANKEGAAKSISIDGLKSTGFNKSILLKTKDYYHPDLMSFTSYADGSYHFDVLEALNVEAKVSQISNDEFNILITDKDDKRLIASIITTGSNAAYLNSTVDNFDYTNYAYTYYRDNSPRIMVDGNLYWLGVSKCAGNRLAIAIYDIPTILPNVNIAMHSISSIKYINYPNGRVSVEELCSKK